MEYRGTNQTLWTRLVEVCDKSSLFWRFQLVGWVTYVVLSFPLKLVIYESLRDSILVSVFRDSGILLVAVGMREVYRRICRDRTQVFKILLVSVVASSIAGLILTGFSFAFYHLFGFQEEVAKFVKTGFRIFYTYAGLCLCWSLLYFGIRLMRDGLEWRLQLARKEAAYQKAETLLLRAQMDPHFLSNALNTIIAEIGKSDQYAKGLVRALAEYLRYSLENRNNEQVSLGDEFDAIKGYLAVEKARFDENLEIECRIDPSARMAPVPGVLIQPLVENAMKYGKRTAQFPKRISVNVSRPSPDLVRVEVSNTGAWRENTRPKGTHGMGLENLQQRLALLYPGAHRLQILKEDEAVVVSVEIPVSHE